MIRSCWYLFTAAIAVGCAGLMPVNQADVTYSEVFPIPGVKADHLFEGTKIWIAQNFRSAKAVIEYEDKATGTLIGNGLINYPCSGLDCVAKSDWRVKFQLRVDIKDEKIRATYSNIGLSWPASSNSSSYDGTINTEGDWDAVKPRLAEIASQLAAHLKKPASSDSW